MQQDYLQPLFLVKLLNLKQLNKKWRKQQHSVFLGLCILKELVPDVELSTWSAGAGVIQSDTHQDRLSEGAQRNIHLKTHKGNHVY